MGQVLLRVPMGTPDSWWLYKPSQKLKVSGELERLIRQCFKVVGSMVVETR